MATLHDNRPVTAATATHVPTPTPTLCPSGSGWVVTACASQGARVKALQRNFIQWSPDGTQLIFDLYDGAIVVLDVENAHLRQRIYPGPYSDPSYGHHADVSPDGDLIAHSTCNYQPEPEDRPTKTPCGWPYRYWQDYEIAIRGIDGSEQRRLTSRPGIDHYPTWSPDGAKIAVLAVKVRGSGGVNDHYHPSLSKLMLVTPDGSEPPETVVGAPPPALFPPVWSFDGMYLAVTAHSGASCAPECPSSHKGVIYTLAMDHPNPRPTVKIGDTTTVPTWSPDESRLAFAQHDGQTQSIHVATPDGEDIREIYRRESEEPITQLLWSPDGEALLALDDWLWTISPDGTGRQELASPETPLAPVQAAWSPDGSRIAVLTGTVVLMNRDGTEVEYVLDKALEPKRQQRRPTLVPNYRCSDGLLVPNPEEYPGLVRDCMALLAIRRHLTAPASTNWKDDVPIANWAGVEIAGAPPRVQALRAIFPVRFRTFPEEVVHLTGLREVDFSILDIPIPINPMSGQIPQGIGALQKLEILKLAGHTLSGPIPEELWYLPRLREFDIRDTPFLTGCIPEGLPQLSVHSGRLDPCPAETNQ